MTFIRFILTTVIAAFLFWGCGPSQSVQRVDPASQSDLSGNWNDTDARMVAEDMTSDILSAAWLQNEESPVLIVGDIRNNTTEHIRTDIFIKEIERAIVNSQKVEIVADPDQRAQIRAERDDQQQHASYESAASLAQELGADYMLIGGIEANVDKNLDGTRAAKFYTVNLELINVESNRKAWIGNKKIKKMIERNKVKW
ncbi:penicillin-binding protein activator LpoB [Fodinibius sp.]|uniref:penicillin-binding protein activator LpoB n=1 Tax=Fodinibius sp. TaxID=1872440 RepID=UPI002ACDCADE|nr:penicillin-binding protein activator LpoB [Fodinibius sp.]MDZ7658980.1 penicillin-binding protein activator LpoB [Fodinibius sp.]